MATLTDLLLCLPNLYRAACYRRTGSRSRSSSNRNRLSKKRSHKRPSSPAVVTDGRGIRHDLADLSERELELLYTIPPRPLDKVDISGPSRVYHGVTAAHDEDDVDPRPKLLRVVSEWMPRVRSVDLSEQRELKSEGAIGDGSGGLGARSVGTQTSPTRASRVKADAGVSGEALTRSVTAPELRAISPVSSLHLFVPEVPVRAQKRGGNLRSMPFSPDDVGAHLQSQSQPCLPSFATEPTSNVPRPRPQPLSIPACLRPGYRVPVSAPLDPRHGEVRDSAPVPGEHDSTITMPGYFPYFDFGPERLPVIRGESLAPSDTDSPSAGFASSFAHAGGGRAPASYPPMHASSAPSYAPTAPTQHPDPAVPLEFQDRGPRGLARPHSRSSLQDASKSRAHSGPFVPSQRGLRPLTLPALVKQVSPTRASFDDGSVHERSPEQAEPAFGRTSFEEAPPSYPLSEQPAPSRAGPSRHSRSCPTLSERATKRSRSEASVYLPKPSAEPKPESKPSPKPEPKHNYLDNRAIDLIIRCSEEGMSADATREMLVKLGYEGCRAEDVRRLSRECRSSGRS